MYTDSTLQPIKDKASYISQAGINYPPDFPKDEIPGLFSVTETAPPDDATLFITGFIVDQNHNQVWQTRKKTAEELKEDWKNEAINKLLATDITIIRCYEAGIPVPNDWRDYRATLRSIKRGDINGPAPTRPVFPEGT